MAYQEMRTGGDSDETVMICVTGSAHLYAYINYKDEVTAGAINYQNNFADSHPLPNVGIYKYNFGTRSGYSVEQAQIRIIPNRNVNATIWIMVASPNVSSSSAGRFVAPVTVQIAANTQYDILCPGSNSGGHPGCIIRFT